MVWGLGPSGEKLAATFPDDNIVKNISLTKGEWSFYAVGWYSGSVLESSVKCGVSLTTLEGQESNVSITMNDANCADQFFSPAAYRTGNAFNPLKFIICDDTTGKLQGQNCDGGATKGSASSFKIRFNEISPDGSLNESMSSGCLNETSSALSSTSTIFSIPVGSLDHSLFDFSIETYSQENCLGNQLDFDFDSSIIGGSGNNLLYTSGVETELFLQVPLIAPNISAYTLSNADYPFNTTISPNNPINIGGTVTAYTVAPALPAGLTLNATTGEISGTPTASASLATYTITATGPGGSDTFDLGLTVLDEPPIFSGYASGDMTYIVGDAITTNIPVLASGLPTSYSISPALPAGLILNTSNGQITGTPTSYTADATYTITGSNNGGTDSINIMIEILDPAVLSFDIGGSYDFGQLPVGAQQNLIITISNSANSSIASSISEIGLAAPFSFTGGSFPGTGGSCTPSLATGSTCTISITYTPATYATINDTLDIQYNNGVALTNSTATISGTGVTPALLTISEADPYDFGSVANGGSWTHTFTISNSGGYVATALSEVSLTAPFGFLGGSYPGTGGDCGTTLAAAANCYIVVEFSPVGLGLASQSININYNDGIGTEASFRAVQGTGVSPALLSIDVGASFDFGITAALPTQPLNIMGSWDASTNTPTLANGTGITGDYYVNTTAGVVDFGAGSVSFAANDIVLYDGLKWHSTSPLNSTTLTVTNIGGFNASAISVTGLSAPFFDTGTGTCSTILTPSSSCTIILQATPLQVASYSASLNLNYDDGAINTSTAVTLDTKGGTIVDMASTFNSRCVVFNNGQVKCWGSNSYGELGLEIAPGVTKGGASSEMGVFLPFVDLGTGFKAVRIVGGSYFFCARSVEGDVKCWGQNSKGQLGLGNTIGRGINVGTMGDNLPTVNLGIGRTAKKLAAGAEFACALLDNDDFVCWGDNTFGQLGIGNSTQQNSPASPVNFGGPFPIDFDLGAAHSCVILSNNDLTCWGYNNRGQLGYEDSNIRGNTGGTTPNNNPSVNLGTGRYAIRISASVNHTTCAVLDDGSLKCWGDNLVGKLGQGNSIEVGSSINTMGDFLAPIDLGTGRYATKVYTTHESNTCAILDTQNSKCWGRGIDGGLGQESTQHLGDGPSEMGDALNEIDLGASRTVKRMMAGATCALLDNEEFKCWGRNNFGQLGLGDTIGRGGTTGDMGDNLPAVDLR